MTNEHEIYEERVYDHYEDPYHRGLLETATHGHEGRSPLCGDVVQVSLQLDDDGTICEAWFDGVGCVISQASASMLMEAVEGKTVEEIMDFSTNEMLALFGPRLAANRQKCCLLSWRVLQTALHCPVDEMPDDDDGMGRRFGGPSLSEET